MVGKSIAVRGTRTAPPSRRRRAAWQRAAIIESYELANPAMIDSGDVDVLLAKYAGGLGRLLQRVQVKYDLVALDGCLMYRKAPGARWKEVSAELHARGRLALYRCDGDEARRALRALAAFGGAADGVALPTGVSVVGWVDARTLASATARDEDGGRYPFVVQAGGETGLAVTLAARTSNERGAWLAALREVASYFRDLRREASAVRRGAPKRRGRRVARALELRAAGDDLARAGDAFGAREAYDGAERAAAAVAGLARVAELDPSLLALVEGEAKAAAAAARALDEAARSPGRRAGAPAAGLAAAQEPEPAPVRDSVEALKNAPRSPAGWRARAAAAPAPPPVRDSVEALKNMPRDPEWGAQLRAAPPEPRCGRAPQKSTAVWPPPKAAEAPTVRESVDALAARRARAWPPPAPAGGAVGPAPRYGHWERESHSIWRGSVLLDGPPSDADENSDWGDDAIADDDDDAIGEPEDAGEDFAFDECDDDALTHGGWSDVSSMPDDAEDELGRPSFAGRTLDI
ncbi:hypothetical protein JL720_1951 [Aureococcus anophagefferens]|nr:hypothetical protein JL720_1951 [Aureococcus anophagefferens]